MNENGTPRTGIGHGSAQAQHGFYGPYPPCQSCQLNHRFVVDYFLYDVQSASMQTETMVGMPESELKRLFSTEARNQHLESEFLKMRDVLCNQTNETQCLKLELLLAKEREEHLRTYLSTKYEDDLSVFNLNEENAAEVNFQRARYSYITALTKQLKEREKEMNAMQEKNKQREAHRDQLQSYVKNLLQFTLASERNNSRSTTTLRGRFEVKNSFLECTCCHQTFNSWQEMSSGMCTFHPGAKVPACTADGLQKFWLCCGQRAGRNQDSPGCTRSFHMPYFHMAMLQSIPQSQPALARELADTIPLTR